MTKQQTKIYSTDYNEYRVGNLIVYNGELLPIATVLSAVNSETKYAVGHKDVKVIYDSEFNPASLTKDILVNFGFDYKQHGDDIIFAKKIAEHTFLGKYSNGEIILWCSGCDGLIYDNIKYAHQIQNIHLFLSGGQLTTKQ
jgi:membrane-bound inhibitor of C-type lysozyme